MLKIYLWKNGAWQDITNYVYYEGLTLTRQMNSAYTAEFEIKRRGIDLEIGNCIRITFGQNPSVLLFEGIVTYVSTNIIYKNLFSTSVKCQDYNVLADRHIVVGSYIQKTVKYIISKLLEQVKDIRIGDVVKLRSGEIGDGITLEKANFNYISLSEALNQISDITAYNWRIDFSKKLHVWEDQAIIHPLVLTEKDVEDLSVEFITESYRNVQWVKGQDVEVSTPRKELKRGDGVSTSFALARSISEIKGLTYPSSVWVARNLSTPPTIPEDPPSYPWQEQKATLEGAKEEGAKWYYKRGENTIRQAEGEEVLGENDYLYVQYTFFEPRVSIAEKPEEIEALAEKERTSGRWAKIELANELQDVQDLTRLAYSLLSRYGRIPKSVDVISNSMVFPELIWNLPNAGDMITINFGPLGISQMARVNTLRIRSIGDKHFRFSFTLLGSDVEAWWQFFAKQKKRTDRLVIGASETIIYPYSLRTGIQIEATYAYQFGECYVGADIRRMYVCKHETN